MATMFHYQTERFNEPTGPRNFTRDPQTGYLDIPMDEEDIEPRVCSEGGCDAELCEEAVSLAECMEVYGCKWNYCLQHARSYDVPEMPVRARACLMSLCPELKVTALEKAA